MDLKSPDEWRAYAERLSAEIEQLRDAMIRAQKETGTSTSTWHVLEDALRELTKGSPENQILNALEFRCVADNKDRIECEVGGPCWCDQARMES